MDDLQLAAALQVAQRAAEPDAEADIEEAGAKRRHAEQRLAQERQQALALVRRRVEQPEGTESGTAGTRRRRKAPSPRPRKARADIGLGGPICPPLQVPDRVPVSVPRGESGALRRRWQGGPAARGSRPPTVAGLTRPANTCCLGRMPQNLTDPHRPAAACARRESWSFMPAKARRRGARARDAWAATGPRFRGGRGRGRLQGQAGPDARHRRAAGDRRQAPAGAGRGQDRPGEPASPAAWADRGGSLAAKLMASWCGSGRGAARRARGDARRRSPNWPPGCGCAHYRFDKYKSRKADDTGTGRH